MTILRRTEKRKQSATPAAPPFGAGRDRTRQKNEGAIVSKAETSPARDPDRILELVEGRESDVRRLDTRKHQGLISHSTYGRD
jgi:hypothetical protein